jgi:hypothetical protein
MVKKNWIGRYGYSFEEGNEWYFSFEINADYIDGSFEGTVSEEEFTGYTNDLVHVKGFIEEDMISFVKTYPHLYIVDEKGDVYVDKSQRGHSVTYQGYFDESKSEWYGEWEVKISEERDKSQKGAYKTLHKIGPWDMKLKSL